jgi:hypothetical protein
MTGKITKPHTSGPKRQPETEDVVCIESQVSLWQVLNLNIYMCLGPCHPGDFSVRSIHSKIVANDISTHGTDRLNAAAPVMCK